MKKSGVSSRAKDHADLNKNNYQDGDSQAHLLKNGFKSKSGKKMRRLVSIKEVPEYLTHNPYILTGYRNCKTTKLCLQSLFWWTNETINIWSHIIGSAIIAAMTFRDLYFRGSEVGFQDKILVFTASVIFQTALLLSAIYHTFSCKSQQHYDSLLAYDILGISFSMLAIFLTGVYFAFDCYEDLRNFYLITVFLIFIIALAMQIPQCNVSDNVKTAVFFFWAVYGVLPTIHGIVRMGGWQHPMVQQLFPRIVGMYTIVGLAFFFWMTRVPECFFPGSVDFIGSSHQFWHILVFYALYYWYNTYILYVEYRKSNGCIYYF